MRVRACGHLAPRKEQGSIYWWPDAGNVEGFDDLAAQRRERTRVRGCGRPVAKNAPGYDSLTTQRWERADVRGVRQLALE